MNAVQCDYCGKFASNPREAYVGDFRLPDDWYFIGASCGGMREGQSYTETGEFCSRECVSKHFERERRSDTAAA